MATLGWRWPAPGRAIRRNSTVVTFGTKFAASPSRWNGASRASRCVPSFCGMPTNLRHGVTHRVVQNGLCCTALWRRISRPCSGRLENKMNRDMAYPSTFSRSSGSTYVAEFLATGSPVSRARPAVARSFSHFPANAGAVVVAALLAACATQPPS